MNTERISKTLAQLFPDACCALNHRNDYEMVIAVVLSAQTSDASVNKVTTALFQAYPSFDTLAKANIFEIEKYIHTLGLYKNKAQALSRLAKRMVSVYHGQLPQSRKELMTLEGVGRKCANVILAECFHQPSFAVDTHVNRVAKRLGLAKQDDSLLQVETKLKRKFPREMWIATHHRLILFGRYICKSQHPLCTECPFPSLCKEYKRGHGIIKQKKTRANT